MSDAELLPLAAEQAFARSIDELAQQIPEFETDRQAIEAGGKELIDDFGIDPSLFADQTSTLMFGALAQRNAQLEINRQNMTTDEYGRQKTFIADATILLARDKSALYPELERHIDAEPDMDDEHLAAVYDQYTNPDVSAELATAMHDSDLLDGVRSKLGIARGQEQPFTVRVLDVASDMTLNGMQPDSDDSPESRAKVATYRQEADRLKQNGQAFREAIGDSNELPIAWVQVVNDEKQLVLPLPIATKILHPETVKSSHYRPADRVREQAFLEHEFVHTQGGLNVDGETFFGVGLEELRAEHFSGNKHGYNDAKAFALDLQVVGGLDIGQIMEDAAASGDWNDVYVGIANKLGLQRALEIAMLTPAGYDDPNKPIQQDVQHYLSGYDAITQKVHDAVADNPEALAATDAAIDRMANVMITMWDKGDVYLSQRERMGLKFVTGKIRQRRTELMQAAGQEKQ